MEKFLIVIWFSALVGAFQTEDGGTIFLVSLLGIPLISSLLKNIKLVKLIDLITNKPINESNNKKVKKKTKSRITDKQIESRLFSLVEIYKNNNRYEIFYLENMVYSLDDMLNFIADDEIEGKLIKKLAFNVPAKELKEKIKELCIKRINEKEKREKSKEIKELRKQKQIQIIVSIIEYHFSVLYTKYCNTHYLDDYGNMIVKGWEEEVEYFINSVLLRENKFSYIDLRIVSFKDYYNIKKYWYNNKEEAFCAWKTQYSKQINIIDELFNQVLEKKQNNGGVELEQSAIKTGIDYENYIETLLKNKGFVVKRTPKSGDQGVDLIVEGNNNRIAIQCKFYSKPVGNKAVQEVSAGKDYYNCTLGCVVSNNSFTPSARKLANSLEITLLNNDAIVDYISVNN